MNRNYYQPQQTQQHAMLFNNANAPSPYMNAMPTAQLILQPISLVADDNGGGGGDGGGGRGGISIAGSLGGNEGGANTGGVGSFLGTSAQSSVNSSSFLAAANTIVLGTSTSPSSYTAPSSLVANMASSESLMRRIKQQHSEHNEMLDFDLHLGATGAANVATENENNMSGETRSRIKATSKQKKPIDDENLFDELVMGVPRQDAENSDTYDDDDDDEDEQDDEETTDDNNDDDEDSIQILECRTSNSQMPTSAAAAISATAAMAVTSRKTDVNNNIKIITANAATCGATDSATAATAKPMATNMSSTASDDIAKELIFVNSFSPGPAFSATNSMGLSYTPQSTSINNQASSAATNIHTISADITPQNSMSNRHNTSRYLRKLQLQKQQAEAEERRAATVASQSSHMFSSSMNNSMHHHLQQQQKQIMDTSSSIGTSFPVSMMISSPPVAPNSAVASSLDATKNMLPMSYNAVSTTVATAVPINSTAATTTSGSSVNPALITMNASTASTSSTISSEIIPRDVLSQVFKLETKLENPTKYHVMQMAKNLQQNTTSTGIAATSSTSEAPVKSSSGGNVKKRARTRQTNSNAAAAAAATVAAGSSGGDLLSRNSSTTSLSSALSGTAGSIVFTVPESSTNLGTGAKMPALYNDASLNSFDSAQSSSLLDPTRFSSPTNSSFSTHTDFLGELVDIVPERLNTILNKRRYTTNSSLQIKQTQSPTNQQSIHSNTVPSEVFFSKSICTPPQTPSSLKASTSLPADVARVKRIQGLSLTEDEIRLIIKDRHKKDTHNMIERRRRFNINDRIKELGTILPKQSQAEKPNKGAILKASVDYIKNLQNEISRTRELEEKLSKMTILNKMLISRIKEFEHTSSLGGSESDISNPNDLAATVLIKDEPTTASSSLHVSSLLNNPVQPPPPSPLSSMSTLTSTLNPGQNSAHASNDLVTAQIFKDAKLLEELILNSPELNPPSSSSSSQPAHLNENDSVLTNVNTFDEAMLVDLYNS